MTEARSEEPCLYTIGYEGRRIGDFLATLLALRVKTIVDVRDSASSRKLGFSSGMLARLAGRIGIAYHHLPGLGVPSQYREEFHSLSTVRAARQAYCRRVKAEAESSLAEAELICRSGNVVLVCYERDARYCHRYALSGLLSEITGLEVYHL
ncbi:MAG: DUF488 family protein [Armatimonadota bacterium]